MRMKSAVNRGVTATVILVVLGCGSDDVLDSVVPPALSIVSGADLSDTISALAAQSLVVQILNETGKPAPGVSLSPKDTAVNPGSSFQYRAYTVDRAGNRRTDPLTFETSGAALQLDQAGRLSANASGIARVRVRAMSGARELVDSAGVAIVPVMQLVWRDRVDASRLIFGELTGSNQRVLVPVGFSPSWQPGGQRIAFVRGLGLFIADLNGNETQVPLPRSANVPEWSPDGAWIYFSSFRLGEFGQTMYELLRVHPDGSGLEVLTGAGTYSNYPAPSPDGKSLAFSSGLSIFILDLVTNTRRLLAAPGDAPRWSPDGQWIAFLKPSAFGSYPDLLLIRPDGTDLHRVGDHGLLLHGVAWSPDSKWIIGNERQTTLVEVATGRMAYLPFGWSEWGAPPAFRR